MSDDREQQVRERAYALWEADGGEHGRHEEHWSRAEHEIGPGGDEDGVNAPTQPEPAEGGDDAGERLPGSPGE